MSESVVQARVELWQTQGLDHCPGEPVPALNHPLGEKPFPDILPEPPILGGILCVKSCKIFWKVKKILPFFFTRLESGLHVNEVPDMELLLPGKSQQILKEKEESGVYL